MHVVVAQQILIPISSMGLALFDRRVTAYYGSRSSYGISTQRRALLIVKYNYDLSLPQSYRSSPLPETYSVPSIK